MAEEFNGFIPQEEWLDVGFNVTRPNDPVDSLVGDIRTDNIIAKWESIAAEYQTAIMAQFHAFDTEANKTIRIPVDKHSIKKALIKVKIDQSELLQEYMDNGVQGPDSLRDYVFNDGIRLAEQVFTRSKVAKAEMLATGKITIKENNLDIPVDYGVPANHINYELDLSPDADISGQIQSIIDDATDNGVTLTGFRRCDKPHRRARRESTYKESYPRCERHDLRRRKAGVSELREDAMDLLIINGHDYSQYIKNTGYGWGRNDLDSSETTRVKNGTLRRKKIATKRKLTFEVMGMTRAQLAQLDDDLSQETFSATYMDLHGPMTRTFYCSSFSAALTTTLRDDEHSWKSDEFTLTEV